MLSKTVDQAATAATAANTPAATEAQSAVLMSAGWQSAQPSGGNAPLRADPVADRAFANPDLARGLRP